MSKAAIFISAFFATVFFIGGTQLAYAKKTQWCIVDKKSGDYTSDCFKTREECQKRAEKKGSGFGCGVSYE
ncbi:MAG: hypothetical protein FJY35_04400 [Betaproteobacteria bacterium]|nr:hypothetical protein [Betaproteobacteria bacterium]